MKKSNFFLLKTMFPIKIIQCVFENNIFSSEKKKKAIKINSINKTQKRSKKQNNKKKKKNTRLFYIFGRLPCWQITTMNKQFVDLTTK